jgi:hypothetical protein
VGAGGNVATGIRQRRGCKSSFVRAENGLKKSAESRIQFCGRASNCTSEKHKSNAHHLPDKFRNDVPRLKDKSYFEPTRNQRELVGGGC